MVSDQLIHCKESDDEKIFPRMKRMIHFFIKLLTALSLCFSSMSNSNIDPNEYLNQFDYLYNATMSHQIISRKLISRWSFICFFAFLVLLPRLLPLPWSSSLSIAAYLCLCLQINCSFSNQLRRLFVNRICSYLRSSILGSQIILETLSTSFSHISLRILKVFF